MDHRFVPPDGDTIRRQRQDQGLSGRKRVHASSAIPSMPSRRPWACPPPWCRQPPPEAEPQQPPKGISPEDSKQLAQELGITRSALNNVFKILEQQFVPPEGRAATLRADDPPSAQRRAAAETAIQKGHLDRAEQLLNEASA
ncbi:MAG TPA: hypothetical protein VI542_04700 [Candidatus Tectomicrobia bacterium]